MKRYVIALSVLVSLLVSCSGKKKISYNAAYCKSHTVKIDDTLTLKPVDGSPFATHPLNKGEHSLSIDDGKPVSFIIEDDGILNIAHEEFVVFPIKFSYGHLEMDLPAGAPNPLVIDSVVVGSAAFFKADGLSVQKKVLLQQANGASYAELWKFTSNELVIPKAWDFDITEQIPASVNGLINKKTQTGSEYRKKVMEAKAFVQYAIATKTFIVMPFSVFPE